MKMRILIRSWLGLILGISLSITGYYIAKYQEVMTKYGMFDFGSYHTEIGASVILFGVYFIAISVRSN